MGSCFSSDDDSADHEYPILRHEDIVWEVYSLKGRRPFSAPEHVSLAMTRNVLHSLPNYHSTILTFRNVRLPATPGAVVRLALWVQSVHFDRSDLSATDRSVNIAVGLAEASKVTAWEERLSVFKAGVWWETPDIAPMVREGLEKGGVVTLQLSASLPVEVWKGATDPVWGYAWGPDHAEYAPRLVVRQPELVGDVGC